MNGKAKFLSPSQAAAQLGVSTKALRLYEQHGLLKPGRTAAGWRTYGAYDMERAVEIATLRAFGFSLAQIGRILRGDPQGLRLHSLRIKRSSNSASARLPMLPRQCARFGSISRKGKRLQ